MILQEYLTKLGFSVDEPSLKKFAGAIAATGARTAELGSTAIETAAAVELMVSKVARSYEGLYYASQRTTQSVGYIQKTQFAFKQVGLSADEANQSIEGIATTLRTQPWLKAIFGGANTPQQVATNLGKSGLPYFLQAKFAEMIGMSEKTLLHLQRFGQVEAAAEAEFANKQRAAGLDPEKLAADSANYGRELNKLEGSLDIFKDKMAQDLIGPTSQGIHVLDEMVQWVSRVDTATGGWSNTLIALGGSAGGLVLVEKILRRILGLSSATAAGKAAGLLGRAAGGLSLGTGGVLAGLGAALLTVKQNDPAQKAALRNKLGPLLYELGLSKSPDLSETTDAGGSFPPVKGGGAAPAGRQREKLQQAVEFFKKAGFPAEAAQGIAAGLFSESGLNTQAVNPTSGATGIAQWLGARKTGFKDQFNKDLKDATFEEQLQYVLYELTKGGEQATGRVLGKGGFTPAEGASKFINGFERPGAAGAASDLRTAAPLAESLSGLIPQQGDTTTKNVTLNSKTDIHVGGGGDAYSTAKQYTDAHNDVNDNLIRNLTAATR